PQREEARVPRVAEHAATDQTVPVRAGNDSGALCGAGSDRIRACGTGIRPDRRRSRTPGGFRQHRDAATSFPRPFQYHTEGLPRTVPHGLRLRMPVPDAIDASAQPWTSRRLLAIMNRSARNLWRPRCSREVTVPTDTSRISAICLYEKPSTSA